MFAIQIYTYDAVSLLHLQSISNVFLVLKSVWSCIFWISGFRSIRICDLWPFVLIWYRYHDLSVGFLYNKDFYSCATKNSSSLCSLLALTFSLYKFNNHVSFLGFSVIIDISNRKHAFPLDPGWYPYEQATGYNLGSLSAEVCRWFAGLFRADYRRRNRAIVHWAHAIFEWILCRR